MEWSVTPVVPVTKLSWKVRLSFGLGHVLNDICASMWFTYLLVFFHLVLGFDTLNSGGILFIGQITDALSTPFIGYQSDKDDGFWLCRYGKRKTWHLIGSFCVFLSFPFIFAPCISCESAQIRSQMIYYASFVIIFQFGWAAVQISHLALIPELTSCEHERTQLTAIRYGFTVISNILIYVVTWVSLKIGKESESQIGPQDSSSFQRVVYIGLTLGVLSCLVFHLGVKEEKSRHNSNPTRQQTSPSDYLRNPKIYQVALIYMSTRLFLNLGQVYIPLYLHETLSQSAESLAIVPLIMYVSGLVASSTVHGVNRILGRVVTYLFGATLGAGTCIWIKFGDGEMYVQYEIYLVAILLGFSGSVLLVTALGITTDFIGSNTDTGAFVYGSMSFADKLGNGVAVMLIQYLKCEGFSNYYRNVLSYVCGLAAIVGALTVLIFKPFDNRSRTVEADEVTPILHPRDDQILHRS